MFYLSDHALCGLSGASVGSMSALGSWAVSDSVMPYSFTGSGLPTFWKLARFNKYVQLTLDETLAFILEAGLQGDYSRLLYKDPCPTLPDFGVRFFSSTSGPQS